MVTCRAQKILSHAINSKFTMSISTLSYAKFLLHPPPPPLNLDDAVYKLLILVYQYFDNEHNKPMSVQEFLQLSQICFGFPLNDLAFEWQRGSG